MANIVLDTVIEEHLRKQLKKQRLSEEEIMKKIGHLLDDGIEKGLKRTYFKGLDDNARESHPIWKQIKSVRSIRTSIIHPHTKRNKSKQLGVDDTRNALNHIIEVTGWISNETF